MIFIPYLFKFIYIWIALVTVLLPYNSQAQTWKVIDGDTIRHGGKVIRLWGIDAPEINQRCLNNDGSEYKCGQDAKTALEVLILDKPLVCEYINKDRYNRDVTRCKVDKIDIGRLMVSLGWAVDYERYSDSYYRQEQQQAQKQKLGLWKGKFQSPKEYRKKKRKK